MLKQIFLVFFLILYLYTLSFDIFLNASIRIPTPLLFGIPLIILFREKIPSFLYTKEILLFFIANFLYYVIGLSDFKSFAVNLIVIVFCASFFNFFVANNERRFNLAVVIFYSLLLFSTVIMLLNHVYPSQILALRERLTGGEIAQSPSGITSKIFGFGYHLAPLVAFLFISSIRYNKPLIIKGLAFMFCLISIYFGLQRSVFVGFICSSALFIICYYKYKSIFALGLSIFLGLMIYSFVIKDNVSQYDNIFAKNERKGDESRTDLLTENLNIYSDYPYGLVFYGKDWDDVTRVNRVFSGGLTSHNAYLMFVTYLGPFLGVILLFLIYKKVGGIFAKAVNNINNNKNALIICLCFSFICVSMNSLFHNSWLINGNGPTIFLYFAILHLNYLLELSEQGEDPSLNAPA